MEAQSSGKCKGLHSSSIHPQGSLLSVSHATSSASRLIEDLTTCEDAGGLRDMPEEITEPSLQAGNDLCNRLYDRIIRETGVIDVSAHLVELVKRRRNARELVSRNTKLYKRRGRW